MQLFEKWQSVTDAYKSFYEEAEHLGLEVSIFLKHFCEQDENKTMCEFISECERNGTKHLLEKQINKAKQCFSLMKQYRKKETDCTLVIIGYLIVALLNDGGFDD